VACLGLYTGQPHISDGCAFSSGEGSTTGDPRCCVRPLPGPRRKFIHKHGDPSDVKLAWETWSASISLAAVPEVCIGILLYVNVSLVIQSRLVLNGLCYVGVALTSVGGAPG
jgi:hypothetical protein